MNKAIDSQSEAYNCPHIVWRRAKLGADQKKATQRVEVNILQRKDTAMWESQNSFYSLPSSSSYSLIFGGGNLSPSLTMCFLLCLRTREIQTLAKKHKKGKSLDNNENFFSRTRNKTGSTALVFVVKLWPKYFSY